MLTLSLLISEDFCVFLSCLSDHSVFIPSDKYAENTASAVVKSRKSPKSSLISKEKVNRVWWKLDLGASTLGDASGSVNQDGGKGGLSLRGVAFMTVLAGLTVSAVLESTFPSVCLSYKIQCQVAVFGRDGYLLKLNPPFPTS